MSAIFWIVDASAMIQAALGGTCHCLARCSWPQRGWIPFGAPPSTTRTQLDLCCAIVQPPLSLLPPLSHTQPPTITTGHTMPISASRVCQSITQKHRPLWREEPPNTLAHTYAQSASLAVYDVSAELLEFVCERRGVSVHRASCAVGGGTLFEVVRPAHHPFARSVTSTHAWLSRSTALYTKHSTHARTTVTHITSTLSGLISHKHTVHEW
jgi:hypothetical protein